MIWRDTIFILLVQSVLSVVFYFIKKSLSIDIYIGVVREAILLAAIWGGLTHLIFHKDKKNVPGLRPDTSA